MTDRDAQESFIRKGAKAMTEEELKYLTALQPEIRKRIGDWRLGDIGYFDSKKCVRIILNQQGSTLEDAEGMCQHLKNKAK